MKKPNNFQALILLTTLITTLTACQNQPITPDRSDLIRSMTYTHRHLVTEQLTNTPPSARYQLLVQSHCDLIERDIVDAPPTQACLSKASADSLTETQCMAEFHQCISQCATFKQQCEPCETQAQQCLSPEA